LPELPQTLEGIARRKEELRSLLRERRQTLTVARQAKAASEHLIDFCQFMMPSPDDPTKSLYEVRPHHVLLCEALERLFSRKAKRMNVNMPPRAGKSQICSKFGPAWYMGHNPDHFVIVGSYNDEIAGDFGEDILTIINSERFKMVFPDFELKRKGQMSKKKIMTNKGGVVFAVGRGSSATGRGAHLAVIDDPIKDREEADSPTIRNKLWKWFTQVILTRLMGKHGVVMIVQTRWHEDDLPGRLLDPRNPEYSEKEAKRWVSVTLPALAEENDPLGRAVGEPLWPERFPLTMMNNMRDIDPRGFASLYQGHPSVEDGDFFKKEHLVTYVRKNRPDWQEMKIYGSGDYATTTRQVNDRTALGVWGVDRDDEIWLLDLWWGRAATDKVVDEQIRLMKKWTPFLWVMEASTVTHSIGPFLKKRMREEKIYTTIQKLPTIADGPARARSFQGRYNMDMVHLPEDHPKFLMMRDELLAFPQGMHDDFVDMCAYFGMKIHRMSRGESRPKVEKSEVGTLRYLKEQTKTQDRMDAARRDLQGW
jgi:predicted phage terminase large subunit-like protein